MSKESIHRNDGGHALAEKSTPVEYRESSVVAPPGDFKIVSPGQTFPHDIGCICFLCVERRRQQARDDPEMAMIVEKQAAKLPPEQANALRKAIFGEKRPWWRFWR